MSFLELNILGSFSVSLSFFSSSGSIRELVLGRVVQGGPERFSPLAGVLVHVTQQKSLKRSPRSLETQPAWSHVDNLRCLTAELPHKIVSNHRCVKLLLERVHFLGSDVLGIHHHLQVANVKLDFDAVLEQGPQRVGIVLQISDQIQCQLIVNDNFVKGDFDRCIGRQAGLRLAVVGSWNPGVRVGLAVGGLRNQRCLFAERHSHSRLLSSCSCERLSNLYEVHHCPWRSFDDLELEEFETGVKIPKGTFDLPEELRKSVRIAEQAK